MKYFTLFILTIASCIYADVTVDIIEQDGNTAVYMEQEKILNLTDNRHLIFRATNENDHWIGQVNRPADLGWAYQDLPGYESQSITYQTQPGWFELKLKGTKAQVDGDITTTIAAQWNSQTERFEYTLSSQLTANLEKWYENSRWAAGAFAKDPSSRVQIEPIDYHIERISILDRIIGENSNPDLYDCFVLSSDYNNWQRIPKLNVAYPIYQGDWVYTYDIPLNGYWGFLDPDEGGWISQLTSCSSDARVEICWSWFDIHFLIKDGLPPRYSNETFTAYYTWKFTPLTVSQSQDILSKAVEIDWKERPEYIRPIFSRDNDFEELINGYESEHAWFSSDPACKWDDKAGFESQSSVCIDKDFTRTAAWYGWFYGYPFEKTNNNPNIKYRLSAMVKTENVQGAVRLAAVRVQTGPGWIYSNLYPEDTWELDKVSSTALTGTNDWTELNVVFTTRDWSPTIVSLELDGAGKCWFDNVKITKAADISKNGRVDIGDIAILAANWNSCTNPIDQMCKHP